MEEPVGKAAESILVADRLFNGTFTNQIGQIVHVFSAKRYEQEAESSLFSHPPDLCWTQVGWRIKPAAPDVITLTVHGVQIQFERRIFVGSEGCELVYFSGLVGGHPLPYRLDLFLSAAMTCQEKSVGQKVRITLPPTDLHRWTLVRESFSSRRPFIGPKQFIRISTPIPSENPSEGDRLLQDFLPRWLVPGDFQAEEKAWERKELTANN